MNFILIRVNYFDKYFQLLIQLPDVENVTKVKKKRTFILNIANTKRQKFTSNQFSIRILSEPSLPGITISTNITEWKMIDGFEE